MRFCFGSKRLEALYTDEKDVNRYPTAVVDSFFEVVASIAAAKDERDLYALKSLRFEKLSGKRKGERSLRLNDQWRLIVELEEDRQGKLLRIKSITDYH